VRSRIFLDVRTDRPVESSWGVKTREAIIYECPQSGLRFRIPASQDEVLEFYEHDYHDSMTGNASSPRLQAYRRENEARIATLQRFCRGGRVLDIGCSAGIFAAQLAAAGFEVYGNDLSEYACEQTRQKIGTDHVFQGPLEGFAEQLRGQLDAVTMMDVIEHFSDVVQPLEIIRDMLKPEGILFLRTPTLRSPFYRVADWTYRLSGGHYKDAILKIYHAEHFYFFNEKNIRVLLEDLGYEVLSIDPDPLSWRSFRTAELNQGPLINAALAFFYFAGRLFGRGHGMKVIARPA
jgi:2-polyprenyl-3-methyl-5-hydroxy-6-metoxy-1,4-benzoquinol methylase